MLFDRDPRWTMVSDKLLSRSHIASKVGPGYLIPLLWSGGTPEEINFDDLPSKFVIKANHGCGYNIIVEDKRAIDHAQVRNTLRSWLQENYCERHLAGMEWGYKEIKPTILIEELLGNGVTLPADYKFLCYSGRVQFVQIDHGRFTDNHIRTFVNRDFEVLDLEYGKERSHGEIEQPMNYCDMLRIAEILSADFDFIRVDLYNVGGRIFVGELTCYPGGGVIRFTPRDADFVLGEKWVWNGVQNTAYQLQ